MQNSTSLHLQANVRTKSPRKLHIEGSVKTGDDKVAKTAKWTQEMKFANEMQIFGATGQVSLLGLLLSLASLLLTDLSFTIRASSKPRRASRKARTPRSRFSQAPSPSRSPSRSSPTPRRSTRPSSTATTPRLSCWIPSSASPWSRARRCGERQGAWQLSRMVGFRAGLDRVRRGISTRFVGSYSLVSLRES